MTGFPTRQSGPARAGTERGEACSTSIGSPTCAPPATTRAVRGLRVGLVPTMGYLHDGHRSLMRAARAATDFVVVTIFVNPLQFGAHEDLDTYPRDLAGDLALCEAEGIDCVFSPSVAEMYPRPPLTTVHVAELTADLCGAARPTHFDGVTTVVAKLFAIVGPGAAFFGRKDAQQLAVVTRMADDLNLPVEVIGCPIVREPDGLAMSSRNAYLSPPDRAAALVLSHALRRAVEAIVSGERDAERLTLLVREIVAAAARSRARVRRGPRRARAHADGDRRRLRADRDRGARGRDAADRQRRRPRRRFGGHCRYGCRERGDRRSTGFDNTGLGRRGSRRCGAR